MRARIWWSMLLRGALAVLIGTLMITWPEQSAGGVIMIVGGFAILTGVFGLVAAVALTRFGGGFALIGALLTIVLGLVALLWSGLTADVLVFVVAGWALLFGLIEICAGLAVETGEAIRALTTGLGLISVTLAVLLFAVPDIGVVAVVRLLGFYLLASGVLRIYRAVAIRQSLQRVIVE